MPTSKKAMDLFLRDLDVAIEVHTREYRTKQTHPDPAATQETKWYLAGLESARSMAREATSRTETNVPTDRMRFLTWVDLESTARALGKLKRDEYVKRETRSDKDQFVEPKRPNDHQLFEEIISMFHECALTGLFPEPRLPDTE